MFIGATLSGAGGQTNQAVGSTRYDRGLIMDGCATAAVEQLCDDFEAMLRWQYPVQAFAEGSPGYGDLVEIQREFLELLDAPRKSGYVQPTRMLTLKSVTVVIGIEMNRMQLVKPDVTYAKKRKLYSRVK